MVKKYPAKRVDMGPEIAKSATVVKLTAASFAFFAVVSFAVAGVSSFQGPLSILLLVLPMAVNSVAAVRITRGGGWLGAAVSNLQLRPDIGLQWLFTQPGYRRMSRAFMVYFFAFLLFTLIRMNSFDSGSLSQQTWIYFQGVVGLVTGGFQAGIFWKISAPLARAVQARLAVPPPQAMAPVQQTFGGAEVLG